MERYDTFVDRNMQYYQDASSSKPIYKFNTIPIKSPAIYIMGIIKDSLRFIRRGKKPGKGNTLLKNKGGGLIY